MKNMNNKTKARAQASQERNKHRDTGIEGLYAVKWIAICLRKWEWTTRDKYKLHWGMQHVRWIHSQFGCVCLVTENDRIGVVG